jgi:CBS domain-containing protein
VFADGADCPDAAIWTRSSYQFRQPRKVIAMLRVHEIMTSPVVSVTPDTPVRDAIELLSTRHLSGVPVVSRGRTVGVVSATDLMTFLAQLPGVPAALPADDESRDDVTVSVNEADSDTAWQATYFAELWHDVGADATTRFENTANPEWDVLAEHDVSEVMTHGPLHTVLPDDPAEHAARLMQSEGIHRVLVVDAEHLVGIVSSLDITRAAADHRFSTRTYVFNHDQDFGDRAR